MSVLDSADKHPNLQPGKFELHALDIALYISYSLPTLLGGAKDYGKVCSGE